MYAFASLYLEKALLAAAIIEVLNRKVAACCTQSDQFYVVRAEHRLAGGPAGEWRLRFVVTENTTF